MKSPTRLADDPELPLALREHLRRSAATAPVHFDVEAARARFEAGLTGGSAGEAPRSPNAVNAGRTATGIGKWLFGAGAAGLCVFALASRNADIPGRGAPQVESSSVVAAAASDHDRAALSDGVANVVVTETTVRAPEVSSSVTETTHDDGATRAVIAERVAPLPSSTAKLPTKAVFAAPARTTSRPPSSDTNGAPEAARENAGEVRSKSTRSSLREETENLGELALLARSEPRQAAQFADEGHRRFPNGALWAERESIAITSLAAVGRTAEARARAERFLEVYPNGPGAERVRRVARPSP